MRIMHRLTLKNLKMNKSRTVITIIGIALSMVLITIITNSTESLKESLYDFVMRTNGNYDVSFDMEEPTSENIEKINLNRNTEEVYLYQVIGASPFKNSTSKFRKYIFMNSYSENFYEKCYDFSLKEGHYPQKPDEIVLSRDFMEYSSKEYKPGDKLTLDMGTFYKETEIGETGETVNMQVSLDDYYILFDEDVRFAKSFTKTYTVVGILESEMTADYDTGSYHVNIYGYTDLSDNIQTVFDGGTYKTISVKIHDGSMDNSIDFISDLTGIDRNDIFDEVCGFHYGELEQSETQKKLAECEFHISNIGINEGLYNSIESYRKTMDGAFYAVVGLIVLIMAASVFIIKNSFSISVTEKTVMYGRLSTVGATPKQIRNSIFFEGFILGAVGISVGLLIGIGGSALTVMLANNLLHEILGGLNIVLSVSWLSAAAAVLLGALTIFLSSLSAAVRAEKISPIEAVRNNKEIRIKKNKKNVFKTPKLINKLFGAGGKLAWKNMKRSRRQYRTVVISIVVSVSIFIGIFSFVSYALYFYDTTVSSYNYNIELYLSDYAGSDEYLSFDEKEAVFEDIAKYDEIDDYSYTFDDSSIYLIYDIPDNKLPKNIKDYIHTGELDPMKEYVYSEETGFTFRDEPQEGWNNISDEARLIAFDDRNYKKLLKKLGYSYDEMKDKAVLVNVNQADLLADKEKGEFEAHTIKYMEDPVGYKLDMRYHLYDKQTELYLPEEKHLSLEIGGEITDLSEFKDWIIRDDLYYGSLIVSKEWLLKNYPDTSRIESNMYISSSDPVKTEQRLGKIDQKIYINNISNEARKINSVASLVQELVYGIIAIISLIAVTNIFNTVTTNMKFRQKEFAMLRSVGMTKHEFNRMITLECSFYTVKALLIGVITGTLETVVIHYLFTNMWNEDIMGKPLEFILPWQSVLISTAAVAVLVFVTTCFSKLKLNKQNIIETIRNDNI